MFASVQVGFTKKLQAGIAAGRTLALAGCALLFSGAALAGVGVGLSPTFQPAMKVGDTYPAKLRITYDNQGSPDNMHNDRVSVVQITPVCGIANNNATCDDGFEEPPDSMGRRAVELFGPVTGTPGCRDPNNLSQSITSFTISGPNAKGAYSFSPDFALVPGGMCELSFFSKVNFVPTKDSNATKGAVQTAIHAGAVVFDMSGNGAIGGGTGGGSISFPDLTTSQQPANATLTNGVNLMVFDKAKIVGLYGDTDNPPSGTITFKLYAPTDPGCTGVTPAFTSGPFNIRTSPSCTINGTTNEVNCDGGQTLIEKAGTWQWVVDYVSGDQTRNPNLTSGCTVEPVQVNKANPQIVTVPQPDNGTTPATATLGIDALSDKAVLSQGFKPTGTITFTLYPQSSFNGNDCSGASVYSTQVTVDGNNEYFSSALAADQVPGAGNYYWKASYSGDANNNPVTHACSLEQVVVSKPSIRIAKSPDAQLGMGQGIISAGQDAVFTIVITNDGPGIATNVKLNDPLPAGFAWTIQTTPPGATCGINGVTLDCTFGNMNQGESRTVVVKAPTTKALCTPPSPNPNNAKFVRLNNPNARATAGNADPKEDPGAIDCYPPDITVQKTPDVPGVGSTINAGEDAVFTIKITNNGGITATGVTLKDTLPGPFVWGLVSVDGANAPSALCSVTANELSCAFPDMATGVSHTVIVKAPTTKALCTPAGNPNGSLQINNLNAIFGTTNAGTAQDPGSIDCKPPNLTIDKTPDAPNANAKIVAGSDAVFTITVRNEGLGLAKAVMLNDTLPAGTAPNLFAWSVVSVDGVPGAGPCGISGGNVLACTLGDMASKAARVVIVKTATTVAQCTPPGGGAGGVLLDNPHATASASNHPAVENPGSIECYPPNIKVEKTPDAPGVAATITAGEDAVFTIKITNNGGIAATGVTLKDTLPAPFVWALVSVDGANAPSAFCSVTNNELSCNFPDMATGVFHTVIVKAPTTKALCTPAGNPNGTLRINNLNAIFATTNSGTDRDPGSIDCNPPNLTIDKTPDVPNANSKIAAGSDAVFTITVRNEGLGLAKAVMLNDTLPAGTAPSLFAWSVVSVDGVPGAGPCTISGGNVLACTLGDMASKAARVVIVKTATTVAQCTPPSGGSGAVILDNPHATASASNHPAVENPGSIECYPPNIHVEKTPDAPGTAATITAGEDAVFTIKITNNGGLTATGVTLKDTLPAPFVWGLVSVDGANAPSAFCSLTNNELSCNFPDMATGVFHTVIVKAPTTKALCTPTGNPNGSLRITNLNAIFGTTNAGTVQNPGSIDCNPPNLVIDKSPDLPNTNAKITAGDDAVFTITVRNDGLGVAKAVMLNDTLPAGTAPNLFAWSVVSVDGVPGAGPCTMSGGNVLACNLGDMASKASRVVIVKTATTRAQCTPPGGGQGAVLLDNPRAIATSTNHPPVENPGSIECTPPRITIVKTPDGGGSAPGLIMAGANAEFTIVVSNAGPGTARGVKLTDALPAGLVWTVFSLTGTPSPLPGNNTCAITGNVNLACDFFNMNQGETRTVVVRAPTTPVSCIPGSTPNSAGIVSINNPKAEATATNAATVENDGTIQCQTDNKCDVSLDVMCAVNTATVDPAKPPKFDCPDPFDGFKMLWDPASDTNPIHKLITDPDMVVDVRVWNGAIGSQAPLNIGGGSVMGPVVVCAVQPGDIVSVSGLMHDLPNGKKAKKPADEQFWEIFPADPLCKATNWTPTKPMVGKSKFRINCKDGDMKKRDDCDTLQGDGHADKNKPNGFINDWRLAGISGDPDKKDAAKHTLECSNASAAVVGQDQQNCAVDSPGDSVTFSFTVSNNASTPVTVNLEDDKAPGGVIQNNIALGAKGSATGQRKFTLGPVAINSTITHTAKLTGNFGQSNACVVQDRVVVSTPCLMGNPATGQLYPYTDPAHPKAATVFNESEVLRKLEPRIATMGETIRMWYSDEHAMLLGVRSAQIVTKNGTQNLSAPVSEFTPQANKANSADHPLTGLSVAQGGVDPAGRPIPPSMFCTDITNDPNDISGDWQMGGTAQGPHFISGTWKSATVRVNQAVTPNTAVITTDADPAANGTAMGPGADPVPAGVAQQGFVTEARWNVNDITCNGQQLQAGRVYRLQFMVHDGDQNKTGGDVGQACATVIMQ